MKNNYKTNPNQKKMTQVKYVFQKALTAIIILVCSATMFSQQKVKGVQAGFGMDLASSANGHSSLISPHVSLTRGNHSILMSPLILKENNKMAGGKLIYSLNLSNSVKDSEYDVNDQPLLQLNFFSYVQYLHDCPVARSVMKFEQIKRRDNHVAQDLTLNTAEAAGGIEVRVNLTKSIALRNCIAFSVYRHLNKEMHLLFHDRSAVNINLSTGITIVLN